MARAPGNFQQSPFSLYIHPESRSVADLFHCSKGRLLLCAIRYDFVASRPEKNRRQDGPAIIVQKFFQTNTEVFLGMFSRRLFFAFALFSTGAPAQWLNFPTPGTPRTHDGKPSLAAPAPRAANGKPDLSGVWHVRPTPLAEMKRLFGDGADAIEVPGMELDTISKYGLNILQDFTPEEAPLRPAALELMRRRAGNDLTSSRCLPFGIPLNSMLSEPVKILQSSRLLAILYEADDKYRQVYTDGRTLPGRFDQPSWNGYSVGKWERDTLVVETAGFNDKSSFDVMGHPHSEALRVVERYHRRDFGHLDAEMTFDDPLMYTKPFTIKVTYELWPDSDIFEFICAENEKDRAHAVKE
jgi:hypothetical protein